MDCFTTMSVECMVTDEQRTGVHLKGSARGLIDILSPHLSGETEQKKIIFVHDGQCAEKCEPDIFGNTSLIKTPA